jgi:AmiR/NasT family two-component response regulator
MNSDMNSDRELIAQLEEAVEHRTVIGKALGILMERFDLDDDDAFNYLARCSQEQNRKLYDIAIEFVRFRELPQTSRPAQTA